MLRPGRASGNEKSRISGPSSERNLIPVDFSKAQFTSRIGQRFRVVPDGAASVEIELIEVDPIEPPEGRPFSVLFRGPLAPVLAQQSHRLEHGELEPFDLFIVAVGPDRERKGMLY